MSKIQFLKAIHNDTKLDYNMPPLFTMSKIQFLKAIHNSITPTTVTVFVVYDVKDTIFESNSQQTEPPLQLHSGCLRCQRYNFWKQFTTLEKERRKLVLLFTMSKIQFLKAIHNEAGFNHFNSTLFTMSKIQFLKAIHNLS